MIEFYLPNFYKYDKLYYYLSDIMRINKHQFYNNIKIGAIYGTFPGAVWNGGRSVPGNQPSDAEYEKYKFLIDEFNSRDIPIRFTWTNSLLTEAYFEDYYCNKLMELANNGFNEVLVADNKLEEYLRIKYPKYKYLSSTTKCIDDDTKIIDEFNKDYYLIVLDWRKNRDYNLLQKLPKNKTEILINNKCFPDCPRVKAHYSFMSKLQLENRSVLPGDPFNNCRAQLGTMYDMMEEKPMMLTVDDIYNTYYKMGFTHWKIEGRQAPLPILIESIVYYMVKPEYKDKVRQQLLMFYWREYDIQ